MPTQRRVRAQQPEEQEPTPRVRVVSRTTAGRTVPTVNRRRQAQQALQQKRVQTIRPAVHEEDEKKPMPLLFRILSWLGMILLCFVIGYVGMSWLMDFFNKKLLLKPENRIENQEDLSEYEESEHERTVRAALDDAGNIQQVSLNLYHVNNDTIAETRQNFVKRTTEDNIRDAVEGIITMSGLKNVKLLHVFRNGETAFLDMSGQFASALNSIGQRKSLLLLTAIVRTMEENFSPLSQVRFLIDSKPPKSGGSVDLYTVWKMPKKS